MRSTDSVDDAAVPIESPPAAEQSPAAAPEAASEAAPEAAPEAVAIGGLDADVPASPAGASDAPAGGDESDELALDDIDDVAPEEVTDDVDEMLNKSIDDLLE